MNCLHFVSDFDFDALYAKKFFDECSNPENINILYLLSEGRISTLPWNGDILRKRNYDRIADIFKNPHVVIVLCNQPELVQSFYLHYVRTGGSIPWSDFLRPKHSGIWWADYLKYGNYVRYLNNIFGKERVQVLFY